MVDRKARDKVIAAFESYLNDEITAFEFDDRLHNIESDDSTVQTIIAEAWCYYDDCKDHRVNLSKNQWDYFQRFLLILHSDAELLSTHHKRWTLDHALAWAALAVFIYLALIAG